MQITRLNGDSSWLFQFQDTKLLLDPWLLNEQIDVAAWFSKQEHVEPCYPIDDLQDVQAIVISHPFTDHCHEATLKKFPKQIPIFASKAAFQKIKKWDYFQDLHLLEPHKAVIFKNISIQYLPSKRILDLTHQALFFQSEDQSIFYTPHGFWPEMLAQCPGINQKKVDVLICTFTKYQLPFYLGGIVNFGHENALELLQHLNATYLIASHDERKIATGWVSRLAKIEYCDDMATKLQKTGSLSQVLEIKPTETKVI